MRETATSTIRDSVDVLVNRKVSVENSAKLLAAVIAQIPRRCGPRPLRFQPVPRGACSGNDGPEFDSLVTRLRQLEIEANHGKSAASQP